MVFFQQNYSNENPLLYKEFAIEFIGFNFNNSAVTRKEYYKVPFVKKGNRPKKRIK